MNARTGRVAERYFGVEIADDGARASVAYGRQLTCSPACESTRRRRSRNRNLRDRKPV